MAFSEEPHVVDIREGSQHQQYWLMKSIQDQVMNYNRDEEEENWKKISIYRLPEFAMKMKETPLTPWVVSFGPYHHGKHNLKPIEEYKQKVLVHFLHRARRPLIDFVRAIEQKLEELRGSYDQLEEQWIKDDERFVKLMIMDGCFMLEILRLDPTKGDKSYPDHDPIFSAHGAVHKLPYIKRDMLMLENQLPLRVLKVLMEVEAGESRPKMTEGEINQLVYKFYEQNAETENLGLHVLELYRNCMIKAVSPCLTPRENYFIKQQAAMPTAVKLHECGVRFEKNDKNCISFDKGVLKLPKLVVDDSTESNFLNLMAFEHLHVDMDVAMGSKISSYVCFMDELVDSEKDVELLSSEGIIHNALGSQKAVAELLNNLTKEVILDSTCEFRGVRGRVNEYRIEKINEWRANFRHTHLKNPWTILALAAAILLLVLTIVQTVYAGISYHMR